MRKNFLATFIEKGYGHILYALLIETILLLLISFVGLFTMETILPGIISIRFTIGKLIVVSTLLIIFATSLGQHLGISFPLSSSMHSRILLIGGLLWTLGILTLSLLSFPPWSIPLFLLSFGTIGYFFYKILEK